MLRTRPVELLTTGRAPLASVGRMNSELNIDFNRRLEEKRTRKEEKRDEDVAVTVPIPAEMPEPAVPVDARMHVEEVGCAMLTGVK